MKKGILVMALALGVTGVASAQYPILIDDFEGVSVGATAFLQAPGFSGSTGGNVAAGTDSSLVSDTEAHNGSNSLRVAWDWAGAATDTSNIRQTTAVAQTSLGIANPIISYANGIELWVKIVSGNVTLSGVGTRDNGDAGAPGTAGSGSGAIELIHTDLELDATVNSDWQLVQIHIPSATVTALPGISGDGALNNAQGSWENLFWNKGANGTTSVELYIDDVSLVDDAGSSTDDWYMY